VHPAPPGFSRVTRGTRLRSGFITTPIRNDVSERAVMNPDRPQIPRRAPRLRPTSIRLRGQRRRLAGLWRLTMTGGVSLPGKAAVA